MVDMYNLSWHYKRLMKIKYLRENHCLFTNLRKIFLKVQYFEY